MARGTGFSEERGARISEDLLLNENDEKRVMFRLAFEVTCSITGGGSRAPLFGSLSNLTASKEQRASSSLPGLECSVLLYDLLGNGYMNWAERVGVTAMMVVSWQLPCKEKLRMPLRILF